MIEKIIAEIHRLKNDLDGYSALEAMDYIESYINAISAPSLPSNLDEAAEFDKMFDDFCDQHPDGLTLNECAEFFYDKGRQAGAEWMTGQGETHELTVESPVLGPPMICCPVHADNGDKVVVQIRKE